ncbi:MAG: hypothetical protein IPJ37_11035 [Bacteroidales bacterium]|nr:hypothetical protein [Bacteroidales bacterium]
MNRSFTKQTLRISFILSTAVIFILSGCAGKEHVRLPDAEILHQNQDQLTQVIIYDVFTPPVASRLYVYSSLAAYEAIRYSQEGSVSIAEKLHGFESMPQPEKDKQYNFYPCSQQGIF